MKQARFRLAITVEDDALIEQVQARLLYHLNSLGTEPVGTRSVSEDPDLLGADERTPAGPRVFWQTSEVKQGADRGEPPPAKRRAVK